jgi:hypothetical protein
MVATGSRLKVSASNLIRAFETQNKHLACTDVDALKNHDRNCITFTGTCVTSAASANAVLDAHLQMLSSSPTQLHSKMIAASDAVAGRRRTCSWSRAVSKGKGATYRLRASSCATTSAWSGSGCVSNNHHGISRTTENESQCIP